MDKAENIKDNLRLTVPMSPIKMKVMMRTASKITTILTSIPEWMITWGEMELILEMVMDSIKRCKTHDNEKAPTD